jgi:hypothetical protein
MMARDYLARSLIMKRPLSASILLLLAGPLGAGEPEPARKEIRAALERALPLIQKGNDGHLEKRACFACHHQAVPLLALTSARSRGVAVDEKLVQRNFRAIAGFLEKNRDSYKKGQG